MQSTAKVVSVLFAKPFSALLGMISTMDGSLIKILAFTAIIALGFCMARSGRLPDGFVDALSKLVFTVTLPCAILHAFGMADFDASLLLLAAVGVCCTMGPWLIGVLITWREDREHRVLMMMNISGFNIGCFALPFVQALFPPAAGIVVCLFDAGNALMMSGGTYAFSSALLSKGGSTAERVVLAAKRLFTSIPFDLYCVLITISLLGLSVPDPLLSFIEPVSDANSFLSMFMLGAMVQFSLNHEKLVQLARLLGLRLVLSVIMSVAVYALLPFDHMTKTVVVALLWAPIGALGTVYTLWAKGDVGLAGLANVITIVIGIVAMTAVALFLL